MRHGSRGVGARYGTGIQRAGGSSDHSATQITGLQTRASGIDTLPLSLPKAMGPSGSPCQLEGGLGSVPGQRSQECIPVIHSSPLLLKGLGSLALVPHISFVRKDEEKPRSVQTDRETLVKGNEDAGYNVGIEIFLAHGVFK